MEEAHKEMHARRDMKLTVMDLVVGPRSECVRGWSDIRDRFALPEGKRRREGGLSSRV